MSFGPRPSCLAGASGFPLSQLAVCTCWHMISTPAHSWHMISAPLQCIRSRGSLKLWAVADAAGAFGFRLSQLFVTSSVTAVCQSHLPVRLCCSCLSQALSAGGLVVAVGFHLQSTSPKLVRNIINIKQETKTTGYFLFSLLFWLSRPTISAGVGALQDFRRNRIRVPKGLMTLAHVWGGLFMAMWLKPVVSLAGCQGTWSKHQGDAALTRTTKGVPLPEPAPDQAEVSQSSHCGSLWWFPQSLQGFSKQSS